MVKSHFLNLIHQNATNQIPLKFCNLLQAKSNIWDTCRIIISCMSSTPIPAFTDCLILTCNLALYIISLQTCINNPQDPLCIKIIPMACQGTEATIIICRCRARGPSLAKFLQVITIFGSLSYRMLPATWSTSPHGERTTVSKDNKFLNKTLFCKCVE